jgi:Ca2+-binding RTX toxin-like protein
MLAAGGLLGLLLMGAAVGGLLSGYDGNRDNPDDDAPRDDAGDDAASAAETDVSTDLLDEFLFGPDTSGTDAPEDSLPDERDLLEVRETAPLGEGVEIPLVRDFDPATDRLVLDFTGTEEEAPFISIDLETSPGNAVVEADGTAVTLVLGAPTMTPAHVDVVMNAPLPDPDAAPGLFDFLLDGGDAGDAAAGRAAMQDALATGGRDALTAGPGGGAVSGGDAGEAIFGSDGDDTLAGNGGRDELHGDAGDDVLSGGDWADYLYGGEGNDTLRGGMGADLAFGGEGDDLILGGAGDDGLQGGLGADTIFGGPGDDVIDGTFVSGGVDIDAGDLIRGGDGNDSIMVGAMDTVSGGAGSDFFVAGDFVASAERPGLVTDFDPASDRIEVVYDPVTLPDPEIGVIDYEEGDGSSITLNGAAVLHLAGVRGLDPASISLRALS